MTAAKMFVLIFTKGFIRELCLWNDFTMLISTPLCPIWTGLVLPEEVRSICFSAALCDFNPLQIEHVCVFPHTACVKITEQITYCFLATSGVL